MLSIVVLISGAGSNLRSLLETLRDARERGEAIGAEVVAIGADTDAANLALAEEFGIPSFVVRPRDFADRDAWGEALLAEIRRYEPDLTILSGFMRLVPHGVVAALSPNLLNTHPAYLPEFPGAHAVRDALDAGATQTGASIIVVDDGVDTGPVVERVRIPIEPGDDEPTLHERIKRVERELLARTVTRIAAGELDLAAVPRGA
ncbi:Phosphoribosylglycinamide formyltransferase [Pseudoclavibacter triregionum]|nr:Phosphoribosylglycinamide formyltransferase [Pseudoclavibacter triregionum]